MEFKSKKICFLERCLLEAIATKYLTFSWYLINLDLILK